MPKTRNNSRAGGGNLLFQPAVSRSMQLGANQLVDTIRPTLGPLPRIVGVDRMLEDRMPELLDSGGTIAKRIVELPNIYADVGAMFVRDFLWQLQDREGDGTATAAVLFQAIYNRGVRLAAAGLNPRRLQVHLEVGMRVILDELSAMTKPVAGRQMLEQAAYTICHDTELSELLGEIFDIVGDYGRLEIRKGNSRGLERAYVEGIYWDRGMISRELLGEPGSGRTELENAAIVVCDLDIQTPQELLPVLTCALQNEKRRLLLIANSISDAALSLLVANNRKPEELQLAAVKTPGYSAEEKAWFLNDVALLCGGRAFVKGAGDALASIRPEDFGRARRVWADREHVGIIGGRGEPRALRRHVATLRAAYEQDDDTVRRGKVRQRIGRLLGGSATLRVGGVTEAEIEARVVVAEGTAAAMRGALREGTVPGGGCALLACRPALEARLAATDDVEARAAYGALIEALAEPMRAIVGNAGYEPSEVLASVARSGPGYGFNALQGKVVDMAAAGIVDPANVQKAAVYAGIGGAALALTIDVLVHRADQPTHAAVRGPDKAK